jgi:tetratricopeptide (TPR) repeat protein
VKGRSRLGLLHELVPMAARQFATLAAQQNSHDSFDACFRHGRWADELWNQRPGQFSSGRCLYRQHPHPPLFPNLALSFTMKSTSCSVPGTVASGYLHEERLDEAISACRRTLNLNPRQAGLLRTLAACLVKQGRQSEATEVARKVLDADPQLTLTRLRARAIYLMNSKTWNEFSAALRIAGIPE